MLKHPRKNIQIKKYFSENNVSKTSSESSILSSSTALKKSESAPEIEIDRREIIAIKRNQNLELIKRRDPAPPVPKQ